MQLYRLYSIHSLNRTKQCKYKNLGKFRLFPELQDYHSFLHKQKQLIQTKYLIVNKIFVLIKTICRKNYFNEIV